MVWIRTLVSSLDSRPGHSSGSSPPGCLPPPLRDPLLPVEGVPGCVDGSLPTAPPPVLSRPEEEDRCGKAPRTRAAGQWPTA